MTFSWHFTSKAKHPERPTKNPRKVIDSNGGLAGWMAGRVWQGLLEPLQEPEPSNVDALCICKASRSLAENDSRQTTPNGGDLGREMGPQKFQKQSKLAKYYHLARIYGIFTRVTIKIHHPWMKYSFGQIIRGLFLGHQPFIKISIMTSWQREKTLGSRFLNPEPHVSLNFIPIGIGSMNAILSTCIYLMFVWNLGVYV